MAEWLYEAGIGEVRAALVEGGVILEAEIEREGDEARAGATIAGRLVRTVIAGRRGIVRLDSGEEILVEPIPAGVSEGQAVLIDIHRAAIPEGGRDKLALGRIAAADALPSPAPTLLERIEASGLAVTRCDPHGADRLEEHGWSELLEEALSGEVSDGQAALRLFPTPAMLLIDVDGTLPAAELARAGAVLAARTIRRMGLAGNIGIDLPTMAGKAERQAAGAVIDAHLPQPYERTAVNGFGFVQIVRRRARPSMIELLRADPAASAALALLRRAERQGSGPATLVGPAPLIAALKPKWLGALATRRGGAIGLRVDDGLPMSGAYAE